MSTDDFRRIIASRVSEGDHVRYYSLRYDDAGQPHRDLEFDAVVTSIVRETGTLPGGRVYDRLSFYTADGKMLRPHHSQRLHVRRAVTR